MTQTQRTKEDLCEQFMKTAANIIVHYGEDERYRMLDDLKDIVKAYYNNNAKLESAWKVKDRVLNLHDTNENTNAEIEGIIKEYKDAISEINPDASNDPQYLDFLQEINFLLEHADTGTSTKVTTEKTDEDFELTADVNVIDPISKKRMKCPVKNTICGHTYDKESITELLKINSRTRCPVIGCQSTDFISLDNLRNHIAMKMYLEKKYPDG